MISVTSKKIPNLKLEEKSFKKAFNKKLQTAAKLSVNEGKRILQSIIRSNNSIASKKLINSITSDAPTTLKQLDSIDNLFVRLFFKDVEYVDAVNTGRTSGKMPPVDKIEQWIIDKRISTDNTKRLAFLIAKSIGEHGTTETNFIEEAIPEINRYLKQATEGALDRFANSYSTR